MSTLSRRPRSAMGRKIAAVLLAGAMLAACGSADDSATAPGPSGADGAVKVRLGLVQLSDYGSVLLGVDKGFFKEAGVDVELIEVTPADLVGGLVSKKVDLNPNTGPGTVLAVAKDVPLQVVGGVSTFEKGAEGSSGSTLLVKKGSPIRTPADLKGKKVAVNLLKSASEFGVRALVDDQGDGGGKDVNIIEVPFPAMGDSLTAGQVDAALVGDPFATTLMATGQFEAPVGDPLEKTFGSAPRIVVVGTKDYVATNPEAIKRFQEGLDKSVQYAQDNLPEVKTTLTKYFKTPPETAAQTGIPALDSEVDAAGFEKIAEVLKRYGGLTKDIDTAALVP